jgi:hypothetical protein
MSQRKSVLYVANITSTVSGVSLDKFIGINITKRPNCVGSSFDVAVSIAD